MSRRMTFGVSALARSMHHESPKGQEEKTKMLASSNWNNDSNTGLSYLNSNNVATNNNRNISTHAELRQHRRLNSFLTPTKNGETNNRGKNDASINQRTPHRVPM